MDSITKRLRNYNKLKNCNKQKIIINNNKINYNKINLIKIKNKPFQKIYMKKKICQKKI